MPTKLDYVQPKKLNPSDELREILERLEARSLRPGNAATARAWLDDLDAAYALVQRLEAGGADLPGEKGRFHAIQTRLGGKPASLLKALGGPAALAEARPRPAPESERWWWYIHELVAAQQQQQLRRLLVTIVVIVVVIGGVILAFNTVLAPSPEVVARLNAENDAYEAIDAGNYEMALAAVEGGLAQVPGDAGLLLFRGVLQQALGRAAEARQSFDTAEAGIDDPVIFLLGRSQLWLRLNRPAEAEQDARAALALDEAQSRGWLLLGQALEVQEQRFEAVLAYEQAGNVALAAGDNEVFVLARMALGRLNAPQGPQ